MSLKGTEIDSKEMELETWPAFVDILSSTVVVLAFAFFILVVIQSISKVTSSKEEQSQNSGGAVTITQQSTVLSDKSSTYPQLTIISPSTLAKNQQQLSTPSSESNNATIKYVPDNAQVSNKNIKVDQVGQSETQVLGSIPKFTDARVMEVLKELITVQQDVIAQQRKVIEQQDTKIQETTKEYQSLLSLVTKNPEVENLQQKIEPKNDQAKFIKIDNTGKLITGTSSTPSGSSTYVLSPPDVASRSVNIENINDNGISIIFNDNAQYLNADNLKNVKDGIIKNISTYQSKGVTLSAKPSDFAISASEGRRIAVDRLLLLRSVLIDLGVNKSLIKFDTSDNSSNNNDKEDNYGWIHIIPNK